MPSLLILVLIVLFPDVVTYGTLAVGTWVRIMRSGCLRTSPKKSKLRLPTRSTLATAQAGAPVFNLYALRLYTSDCTGGRCYLPPQCCVPAISPARGPIWGMLHPTQTLSAKVALHFGSESPRFRSLPVTTHFLNHPYISALQTQDRYLVVCRDVCVQRTDNIKTTSHFVPYRHYCVLRVNGAEGRPCFTVARIAYTKLGRSNLCLIHCNVLNV